MVGRGNRHVYVPEELGAKVRFKITINQDSCTSRHLDLYLSQLMLHVTFFDLKLSLDKPSRRRNRRKRRNCYSYHIIRQICFFFICKYGLNSRHSNDFKEKTFIQ
jgi:hypothetical protein